MELKDFVRDTIMQICEGVKEAQEAGKKIGAEVNPRIAEESPNPDVILPSGGGLRTKTDIHFKAILQSSTGKNGKSGIGVILAGVTLGTTRGDSQDASSFTSVEFSVSVAFPFQPL